MNLSNIKTVNLSSDICLSGYEGEYCFSKIEQTQNFYEQKLLDKWFTNKNAKVIYDIGANIGNHTVYFAKIASEARIYSFEPFPDNFAMLSKNIVDNRIELRVQAFQTAIGHKQTSAYMKVMQDSNLGAASIVAVGTAESCEVGVTSIDTLDLPPPDFVKIDVEGHEVSVLKGMEKTLSAVENATIWIEIDDRNAGEVYDIMNDAGYGVVDYSLEASNNVLWAKKGRDTLNDKEQFVKLISNNELKQALLNANKKYRAATEQNAGLKKDLNEANNKYREATVDYARLKSLSEDQRVSLKNKTNELAETIAFHKKERGEYIQELSKVTTELAATNNKLAEALAAHSLERTQLLEKTTLATQELGSAIDLLRSSEAINHRLNAQVLMLQKSNEQYQQKINRIVDTWYGKFALKGYRFLKKIRRLIRRTK